MWALFQILACLIVVAINAMYRQYGLTWNTWAIAVVFILPMEFFCGRSFEQAPSFFSVWFLGSAVLTVFGFAISLLFFDGVLIAKCYVGMVLTVIGAYLLVT